MNLNLFRFRDDILVQFCFKHQAGSILSINRVTYTIQYNAFHTGILSKWSTSSAKQQDTARFYFENN